MVHWQLQHCFDSWNATQCNGHPFLHLSSSRASICFVASSRIVICPSHGTRSLILSAPGTSASMGKNGRRSVLLECGKDLPNSDKSMKPFSRTIFFTMWTTNGSPLSSPGRGVYWKLSRKDRSMACNERESWGCCIRGCKIQCKNIAFDCESGHTLTSFVSNTLPTQIENQH